MILHIKKKKNTIGKKTKTNLFNVRIQEFYPCITPTAQAFSLSSAQVLEDVRPISNAGTDAVGEESSERANNTQAAIGPLLRKSARLALTQNNHQAVT